MTTCNAKFCFNFPIHQKVNYIFKKFKAKLKLQKDSQ